MRFEMSPRDRVYAAVNHKEPDRVPICFGGQIASGITECPPDGRVCSRLYDYLRITDAESVQYSDVFNIVENLDERVMQRLHSDMRQVGPNPPRAVTHPDGTKTWPFLCGARIKKTGYYDDFFDWPLRHVTTEKDIDGYPWPDLDVDIMEGVVQRARYLHEETDYWVHGECLTNFFPFNGYGLALTGIDRWFLDMKIRPKFYHRLAEKLLEIGKAYASQFFGGVGQYLDSAGVFDDLGTQQGGLISYDDYLKFYKPYQAEMIKHVKKYLRAGAKIIIHCCGSIYQFIEDFIEIGVDVLNPVQPLARNMEPWRLKRDFGGRIAFLGGFDLQQLLPLGTVEQIREGAKKLIQEFAPGGGFIFAASHNIEPDTSPQNIVAMFDSAYEYGKYPIPEQTGSNFVDYIKSLNLGKI